MKNLYNTKNSQNHILINEGIFKKKENNEWTEDWIYKDDKLLEEKINYELKILKELNDKNKSFSNLFLYSIIIKKINESKSNMVNYFAYDVNFDDLIKKTKINVI